MNFIAYFFAIIGVLAACLVILAVSVSWWEARRIERQSAALDEPDPARSSATPLVPSQWTPSAEQLRDPNSRDTPPHDSAS